MYMVSFSIFFQAEDGIRARYVTGVQTCALPICLCGRAILDALIEGKLSIQQMVELVHRRMEVKKPALRQALALPLTDHHRFMLRQLLGQIDDLDRMIEAFDARVGEAMSPLEQEAVRLMDQEPGFDRRS